jgi:preprotein translocase subunit SecD
MRNKKVHITIIIIFIIIIGVSLYYILTEPINLGLDLKGGTQIILKPIQSGEEEEIPESKIELTIDTIMKRIDRLGVSEPLVTKDSLNNIVVQLPGVKDPDAAKEIIGKTAQLEFRLVMGTFISLSENKWDLIRFDNEKGQLVIDSDSQQVFLIDDINSIPVPELNPKKS